MCVLWTENYPEISENILEKCYIHVLYISSKLQVGFDNLEIEMQSLAPSHKMVVALLLLFSIIVLVDATPTIDIFEKKFITTKLYGICIRNCAQCKKMYVDFFDGQLCADACVKFKGKIIPDCEDLASISPFLVKFE